MKRTILDIRNIIIVILAVALGITLYRLLNRKTSDDYVETKLTPVKTYIDKKGVEHNEIKIQQTSESTVERIAGKNAVSQTKFTTKLDTVFQAMPVYVDTASGDFYMNFKDNYIDWYVDANTKTRTGDFSLKAYDTITHTVNTKSHLFRPDEYIVDLQNKSDYTDINFGSAIAIKERKIIASLGLGVGVNVTTGKPAIIAGILVPIFSIKTK